MHRSGHRLSACMAAHNAAAARRAQQQGLAASYSSVHSGSTSGASGAPPPAAAVAGKNCSNSWLSWAQACRRTRGWWQPRGSGEPRTRCGERRAGFVLLGGGEHTAQQLLAQWHDSNRNPQPHKTAIEADLHQVGAAGAQQRGQRLRRTLPHVGRHGRLRRGSGQGAGPVCDTSGVCPALSAQEKRSGRRSRPWHSEPGPSGGRAVLHCGAPA